MRCVGDLPDGMADTPGPMRDRFGDQFPARSAPAEQISVRLKIEFGEQPGHRVRMRLKPSVGQDMRNIDSSPIEFVSDEKRPMAVKRFLLRAHQCDAVLLRTAHDPLQAVAKLRCAREAVITNAAVFVTGWIVGSPTQLAPEICIFDTRSLERSGKPLAIEMRIEAAVRRGTHIRKGGHAVSGQKIEKDLRRMAGMTDRKDGAGILVHDTTVHRVR